MGQGYGLGVGIFIKRLPQPGDLALRNAGSRGQATWVRVWDPPRTAVRRAVIYRRVDVVSTRLVKYVRQ